MLYRLFHLYYLYHLLVNYNNVFYINILKFQLIYIMNWINLLSLYILLLVSYDTLIQI